MDSIKCSVCGVIKENNRFQTQFSSMTPLAFYEKCCIHAKQHGCINKVKSTAKPEDFDKHCKRLGADTQSFLGMARELRSELTKEFTN